ncbi:DDE-domain-containing protein [Leucogyrophana mollusca]|uniref:DDE-domain-containing protein n=1 Tax=Leucogyrophana mollusca TaxID=85980 RepID=A0ACB8BUC7_9AGAM|nr:DDE-domain-containing protein [Leucogyrophana mollusca]
MSNFSMDSVISWHRPPAHYITPREAEAARLANKAKEDTEKWVLENLSDDEGMPPLESPFSTPPTSPKSTTSGLPYAALQENVCCDTQPSVSNIFNMDEAGAVLKRRDRQTNIVKGALSVTGDTKEQQLQLALQAVVASGLDPKGQPKLTLRRAATQYGVSRTTLTARYNGRKTRVDSHAHQQRLTPAQEAVLKEWIKALGYRGVPLSHLTVAQHASVIIDEPVSENWARHFRTRHPDLKARWSTGLECCRARALNRSQVSEYFTILGDLISRYNVLPSNIYNMDEKGIQLGIGKRTLVFVDRDQKTVQHLVNGDRELVTVIETVSADGIVLPPSVIFKAKRRNLAWGRNNPCRASISISQNGWTDMDLGLQWLINDFEPTTSARNASGGWRLLILDGHNSHCTYPFVDFCDKHKIILLCLPSHTTHRLQPCDVGIFGPLASSWKSEVNRASAANVAITKYNLLEYYHAARGRAFTPATIQTAFRKTGIWPFDPNVIEESAYAPALNTTTKASQPVPTVLPPLLEVVEGSAGADSAPDDSRGPATEATIILVDFPPPLRANTSRKHYLDHYEALRQFALKAKAQMEGDFASKKLMEAENERLREQLFAKKKQTGYRREGGSGARHMTSTEMMDALAKADWEVKMKDVHEEAAKHFKQLRLTIRQYEKASADAQKRSEREKQAAVREAVREAQKALKVTFSFVTKRIAQAQKTAHRELLNTRKAGEMAAKKAAAQAKRAAAAAKREALEEKRQAAKEQKELKQTEKARRRLELAKAKKDSNHKVVQQKAKRTISSNEEPADETAPMAEELQSHPRPRPRPRPRRIDHLRSDGSDVPRSESPLKAQVSVVRHFGEDVTNTPKRRLLVAPKVAVDAEPSGIQKDVGVRRSTRRK